MGTCLTWLALLLRVEVHRKGEDEHDDGKVDTEFEHLPLEKQTSVYHYTGKNVLKHSPPPGRKHHANGCAS